MADPKLPIKGTINPGEHSPERLDKTLAYFSQSGLLNPQENSRRVPKPRRTSQDPYAVAKYVTEKVKRFFEDCMVDEGLVQHPAVGGVTAPMEVIYAIELLWLNVVNAENIPASAEDIQKARDAAFAYYEQNRHLAKEP